MATSTTTQHGLFDTILNWYRNWQARRAAIAQVADLAPDERARIAHDSNLSVAELQTLAGKWPSSTELLPHRMATLHLDPNEMIRSEPAVLRDLQRTCALCGDRGRCRTDLAENPDDPVWAEYCPNVYTFDALEIERMRRRSRQNPEAS
jgi:hypothetical protein